MLRRGRADGTFLGLLPVRMFQMESCSPGLAFATLWSDALATLLSDALFTLPSADFSSAEKALSAHAESGATIGAHLSMRAIISSRADFLSDFNSSSVSLGVQAFSIKFTAIFSWCSLIQLEFDRRKASISYFGVHFGARTRTVPESVISTEIVFLLLLIKLYGISSFML